MEMNETALTNGRRATAASKNGHSRGDNHRTTNGTIAAGKPASLEQPLRLTSLLVALVRELIAVDDQVVAELPLRQLRVCATLHEGPRAMSALSRELGVSLSAMTQIADRLERARLVKRAFTGTDRRVRCLQLTGRGQRIMRLRENARIQRASKVLRELSAKEQAEVVKSMEVLLAACNVAKT
jgi:DNA-binding MarR family transcriptional regulator